MKSAFITHPNCDLHEMGKDHPEQPARLRMVEDFLFRKTINLFLQNYTAPKASQAQLTQVHSTSYMDKLFQLSPTNGLYFIDADTALNPHSLEAAFYAAGAGILGVDLAMRGEVDNAFCAIRPPGHHAQREKAGGFCFFNNIAVAAVHALQTYNLERVAILDFDAHHGNGTEDIFLDNSQVLLCSVFQDPLFPGPDYVRDNPHIINVPLKPNTGSSDFQNAVLTRWIPALEKFRPAFIFVSAGFDAYIRDDLSDLNWQVSDYSWITKEITKVANQYCQGRIVSMLEGGYYLPALGECVGVHIEGLMGI